MTSIPSALHVSQPPMHTGHRLLNILAREGSRQKLYVSLLSLSTGLLLGGLAAVPLSPHSQRKPGSPDDVAEKWGASIRPDS